MLFYTDDHGTYLTDTRDRDPERMRELERMEDDTERILAVCRQHTVRLGDERLDLPAAPGHMMEPNFWMANAPGSTLFIPVGDVSEQVLGILAIFLANGYRIQDDLA